MSTQGLVTDHFATKRQLTRRQASKSVKHVETKGKKVATTAIKTKDLRALLQKCTSEKKTNTTRILENKQTSNEEKTEKCVQSKAQRTLKETNVEYSSAAKTSRKRSYAYMKFHSLAQDIPKSLILPLKYKNLQDMFESIDTVVQMRYNRQETVTWEKLQKDVKAMLKKKFERNNLCQIKHVYPDAYTFRQEKGIPSFSDNIKYSDHQLTVEPSFVHRKYGDDKKMTSEMLVLRKRHFHVSLLSIVKRHHQKFLQNLDPPVEVDNEKLKRWHPNFLLDCVPDIPLADLPFPPDHDKNTCKSAKQILDMARCRLTEKAAAALSKAARKSSDANASIESSTSSIEENNNNSPVVEKYSKHLAGISSSLLAKIREKEAKRKAKLMIRSEADDATLQKLRDLPEVARLVRTLFVSEAKGSLLIDFIAIKVARCCAHTSKTIKDHHLRLLASHLPSWFTITAVRGQEYGRLHRDRSITDVVQKLQGVIKEAEKL